MNIKQLTEELEKILESKNVKIEVFTLIPHGEMAVKYYDKSVEYFKSHIDVVKKGYVNLPVGNIGISDDDSKTLGYEFK